MGYSPQGRKERHDCLIKTFKEVKKIMLKELRKSMGTMSH